MNVLEAIKAKCQLIPAKSDEKFTELCTAIAIDRSLTTGTTYTSLLSEDVDFAVADIYLFIATTPNLSEGDVGFSVDRTALRSARKAIFNKYGYLPPEEENAPINTRTLTW